MFNLYLFLFLPAFSCECTFGLCRAWQGVVVSFFVFVFKFDFSWDCILHSEDFFPRRSLSFLKKYIENKKDVDAPLLGFLTMLEKPRNHWASKLG